MKKQMLLTGFNFIMISLIVIFAACGKKSNDTAKEVSDNTVQQFDMTDKPYDIEAENLSRQYGPKVAISMAQLQRGLEFAEANGIEKLIEVLNNPKDPRRSRFVQGDYYIWIFKTDYKSNAIVVAHPINKAINNRDFFEIKDASGKTFIKDIIRVTATKGRGWVQYSWAHPRLMKAMDKLTFSEKFGDYILNDGFYLHD